MPCPTCDDLDQRIMLLRSRMQHAEDPSFRNTLEREEAALVQQLNAHKAVCREKNDSIR